MKKLLVLLLVLGLAVSIVGPAGAKKKKKKAPKPYVTEEVEIQLGHPMNNGNTGTLTSVTGQEFLNTCAIPASNGVDGWVFEVPAEYQKISTSAEATGTSVTDAAAPADLDMYFYDEGCAQVGQANAAGTDEFGAMSPGVAFIFLHNYAGGPTTAKITLKPLS
jgi:hypothetical protein